jgi:hypothetical protein
VAAGPCGPDLVELSADGAEGVIVAQSSNDGDWSLYPKGGKLKCCCNSRGNEFTGRVKGVQLTIAEAAEGDDHLVSPEEAVRIAIARQ